MSVRLDFRVPKKHKQMLQDLAKNRGVKDAVIYREAVEQFISSYSTIPSLKEVYRQVETHERELTEIKKALLKKGIIK